MEISCSTAEKCRKTGNAAVLLPGYGSEVAADDAFALDLRSDRIWRECICRTRNTMDTLRDQSVFGDGISIEDTMAVMVRYDTKAILTYSSQCVYAVEGYRVLTGLMGG